MNFFSATFPNLRYNENQIIGLKLVVNIKQQLQMKKDDLIKESSGTWTSQTHGIKCSTKSQSITNQGSPSPSNLNSTKIKHLLNPTATLQNHEMKLPVTNTIHSQLINGINESKSVAQIFQNKENKALLSNLPTSMSPIAINPNNG